MEQVVVQIGEILPISLGRSFSFLRARIDDLIHICPVTSRSRSVPLDLFHAQRLVFRRKRCQNPLATGVFVSLMPYLTLCFLPSTRMLTLSPILPVPYGRPVIARPHVTCLSTSLCEMPCALHQIW